MTADPAVGEQAGSGQTYNEDAPQGLPSNLTMPSTLDPHQASGAASLNVPSLSNPPASLSVAIDPVALITTECISVTAAMRKHSRWAHSSVSTILGGAGPAGHALEVSRPSSPSQGLARRRPQPSRNPSVSTNPGRVDYGLANRWGLRGKKGKSMQDNPLMSAFAHLRSDLAGCRDIRTFDTPALLHPFLQVIRSSSTSAPITSLAIIAITKFFAYNLINKESPRLPLAMQLLASAITHCRFEASDSSADEIVLLRILKLMEGMLSRAGGETLGDESVCEMMETGLSMCCQIRLSELLRRSAEISMVTMCQVIFERLKHLEVEAGEELGALERSTREDMETVKMDPSIKGNNITSPEESATEVRSSLNLEVTTNDLHEPPSTPAGGSTVDLLKTSVDDTPHEVKPYSLPSIRELLRVLVDLLNPHDRQHNDTMRVMALRIIDVAFEVAGPSIAKHPSLAALAKDHLCRHLFQLVRSDNMAILNESLRVAGTLLATCRGTLKLQQELFLSYLVACLHPRVEIPQESGIDPQLYEGIPQAPKLVKSAAPSSGRSTPVPIKDRQKLGMEGGSRKPDAREAMVESVCSLARIPSFMVELYVNYDCEVDRGDLCEDMIGLLSRNAFPDSATWSTTNVPPLCLDALLGYVQFIADRLDMQPKSEGFPDRQRLKEQRSKKKTIVQGATKFNENPKAGIAFLASQGIIENSDDPHCVTRFLKGTTRISKKVLGDYISKKSNEHILEAFLDLFDFSGKRVDEALRELLESFRLPGESPLIERIITVFSEKYCASSTTEGVADKDAVYILTYAIIMLNTDQHNPNIKTKRMDYTAFAKNLRGVNNGNDFAPEYLQKIYDSIKDHEIILPDEHENKHAFDYAWKELLLKTEAAGDLVICDTNIFDADMFAATWKPVIATLCYVFLSASDDAVFSRVVTGFDQCASIATKYGLTEAVDRIVYSLSQISTLASDAPLNTALNTEIQVKDSSVMVSELAVRFGRDFKAQLATVVLFRVVAGNEAMIRNGWKHIVRTWLNLFINSLIPPFFSSSQSNLDIPPIPLQNPSQVIDRGQRADESGLFSAFTSYLSSYAADDPPEPSEEELESTLCTVDCVNACFLGNVFSNINQMPTESIKSLVASLLDLLPEDSSPIVIVVKAEVPPSTAVKTNGHRPRPKGPIYDPTVVYVLEFATMLALTGPETVEAVGQTVAEALQTVIRDAANVHPVIVSRTVFYLLNLLHASHEHAFIRAPVILHSISSLDKGVLERSALPILQGISLCIKEQGPLRKEMTTSPDFWAILTKLHSYKEASAKVFEIVENVSVGTLSAITADNYESAISLLNDFATAGSIGSISEQKYDKVARRSKTGKQSKPKSNEVVTRGSKAVSIVYQLTSKVPALIQQSHLERNEAWAAYWSPVFRALTSQCVNPCREIRHQAFSSLQRSLLSPELTSAGHKEWTAIFGEVLFPLIIRLLKPEIYQSDPVGMSETRVQAATLLCKVFLHYLVLLSEWDGMLDLWLKILDIMDRLINSGQGDNLEEAVPESLKNILLVMSSGGYLVPRSQDPNSEKLWVETWNRLDRFLPKLMPEVFPEEVAKPAPATSPNHHGSTKQPQGNDLPSKEASKEQPEQPAPSPVKAE
ncbi:MAG: GDP/GTP exchange factor for ARF [Candelina mexicana]|nr:MAG: GDP/GTP exchange factor for ARF [Candelina mexicana]